MIHIDAQLDHHPPHHYIEPVFVIVISTWGMLAHQ